MPSPFRDGLFAAILDGGKSAFCGVVSLWAGIAWGGIVASTTPLSELSAVHWVGGTALFELLAVLLGTPWGFLLIPVLAVIFHGTIGREWNRFMVAAALAAILGTAFILAWLDWSTPRSWARLPYPLALLALGLARHLYLRLRKPPRPTP